MPAPVRTQPIPSRNVDSTDVAVATSQQLRNVSQASRAGAGQTGARRTVTSSTFVSSSDTRISCDTTGGAITLTLPFADEYPYMRVEIERSAGANNVTVAARTGDTVNITTANNLTVYSTTDNATWRGVRIGV
jgi:hypothetical protein